ncbi:cytochrome P450 [Mycobacterium crocinum]|uniref:Cytochrome P450 n=1 Tax=Mycolicibacterium crocinum TaxID=388459 RepID=A0ABY3TNK9_9MYCO|nr:cytochrome P450 [Mycolicibacterium crocinum]MCV7217387.1 cytochrome P450 [Mycolicibacterium crocinum]ULN42282.1 cytochrome P450 [Mycolicibacterium crocinum]
MTPAGLSGIPTAPGRLPLIGHAHMVTGDPRDLLLRAPEIGPIVRVYLGPRASYLLTAPELIRDVSLGRAGAFHREPMREAIHELVSGATNVLSGPEHDLRRRLIAPVFRQRRLNEYGLTVATIADDWSGSLTSGTQSDLRASVHDLVMRTMLATLFRAQSDADEIDVIRDRTPWLLSEVIIRGALPKTARQLRVLANRRFIAHSRQVRAALRSLIERRRHEPDEGDMLSALLHHVDEETGATLSDDNLVDELLLSLAASIGSQSSMFSWLIYETSRSPEVAAKIRAELDSVIGSRPAEVGDLPNLRYLRNVLTETLRLWAPWISILTADGPVRIGSHAFPDGTNILFSPLMVHLQDKYFPNARAFDPDRWDSDSIDRDVMMAFGMGQRHCPGSQFALLSITLQAAALFSRWDIELPAGFTVKPQAKDFVLSPASLPVTFRHRG